MFPPPEAEKMNLHYSMRILPHDQNSGGFFVALLKKQENFEWLYEKKGSKMEEEGEQRNEEQREEDFLNSNMPDVENAVALEDEGQKEKEEKELDEAEEEEGEQKMEEEQGPAQNAKDKKSKESLKYERFENISEEEF